MKTKFLFNALLSIIFVILIALPLASRIMPFSPITESMEKRELAEKPKLTLKTLLSFPTQYEEYFNDHFGFRNLLVYWNNMIKVKYLEASPFPTKVIIGRDDWLFYAGEGALENYRRRFIFTKQTLEQIRQNVEKRNKWFRSRGIAYYLVFVPEKQTIYPEFMPTSIQRMGKYSKLDQVVSYLKKHSDVTVVDLREGLLRQKKKKDILYDRLGTHWNEWGAFVGCKQLINAIAKDVPDVPSLKLSDYLIKREIVEGGELPDMIALQGSFFKENVVKVVSKNERQFKLLEGNLQQDKIESIVISENENNNLPRLVMFRDSFATRMIPYLSECFSRSVYVWSFGCDTNLIEREKPDIVINEVEERYLEMLS